MAKFKHTDGCVYLSADAEHPVSSKLCPDGSLSQQGISSEGVQREVGVRRTTEPTGSGSGQRFCWHLSIYQHGVSRAEVPLGCSRGTAGADGRPPAAVQQMARAWAKLAEAGRDPRSGSGGVPRGQLWHREVLSTACGASQESLEKALKRDGFWSKETPVDATEGLGRARRRRR